MPYRLIPLFMPSILNLIPFVLIIQVREYFGFSYYDDLVCFGGSIIYASKNYSFKGLKQTITSIFQCSGGYFVGIIIADFFVEVMSIKNMHTTLFWYLIFGITGMVLVDIVVKWLGDIKNIDFSTIFKNFIDKWVK